MNDVIIPVQQLIDKLQCCIEGKDKSILELDIKLNNSIEISKLEEVIRDLKLGSKDVYSGPIAYRLQTIIDQAKK